MRKNTGRALRFSATAVGMAALGMTFTGTAHADDIVGNTLDATNNNGSDSGGSDTYGAIGQDNGGVRDIADGATRTAGLGQVSGITGGLPVDQLPISGPTDHLQLPKIDAFGLTDMDGNQLPSLGGSEGHGIATSFTTPGLTDLKILPLG